MMHNFVKKRDKSESYKVSESSYNIKSESYKVSESRSNISVTDLVQDTIYPLNKSNKAKKKKRRYLTEQIC